MKAHQNRPPRVTNKPPFAVPLRQGFFAFWTALPKMALFTSVFYFITSQLIQPLLSSVLQGFLRFNGRTVVFNNEMWEFLLSVPGLVSIFALTSLGILLIYFECAVLTSLARQAQQNGKAKIRRALSEATWALRGLRGRGALFFFAYVLILLPLVHLGPLSSWVPELISRSPIATWLARSSYATLISWGLGALMLLAFGSLFFIMPAMVLDGYRFKNAIRKNAITLRAYGTWALALFGVFVVMWLALYVLPRFILDAVFNTEQVSLRRALAASGTRSVRGVIAMPVWLVCSVLQVGLLPLLLSLLTAFYQQVWKPLPEEARHLNKLDDVLEKSAVALRGWLNRQWSRLKQRCNDSKILSHPLVRKCRKLILTLVLVLLWWVVYSAYQAGVRIHDPVVIGHRGSMHAVENTLDAFQQAINAGADYVEVDVMLSGDGVPVVIHDSYLRRLTGRKQYVFNLTVDELKQHELSQSGFTATVSTLDEVAAFCKGKIRMLIEFKPHGREKIDTIEQVVQIMERHEMMEETLFMSINYNMVRQMKRNYPQSKVGYCVYGSVGRLDDTNLSALNIDFLVAEEKMVTEDLVYDCYDANLPLYVWTVNRRHSMEQMLQVGALGLITDYPEVAVQVMQKMYDTVAEGRRIEIATNPS